MKSWKTIHILFAILVIYILMKLAGFESYKIPGGIMENTIPAGSRIVIRKMNFYPNRFDIIVFRNPERDTITVPYSNLSYYSLIRTMDRNEFDATYEKVFVPLNKREQWVGRCVGLPGDKVSLINSDLFVNDKLYQNPDCKKMYILLTKNNIRISAATLTKLGIDRDEFYFMDDTLVVNMTLNQANKIKNFSAIDSLYVMPVKNIDTTMFFVSSQNIHWNLNAFNEVLIPKKGIQITLSLDNLPLYYRLITVYEQNKLDIIDDKIYINGKLTNSFIPKMNYFLIINDNRHNSIDSRYWGFLPENHIYGKVLKIIKKRR